MATRFICNLCKTESAPMPYLPSGWKRVTLQIQGNYTSKDWHLCTVCIEKCGLVTSPPGITSEEKAIEALTELIQEIVEEGKE